MEQFDFPVTFYHRGFSHFHRIECHWLSWKFVGCEFYLGTFRQNLQLNYLGRNESESTREHFNGNSHFVLIEGWGHPTQFEDIWMEKQGIRRLRYPVFDALWIKEFDMFFNSYLQSTPQIDLLLDTRNHDFSLTLSAFSTPNNLNEGAVRTVVLNVYERSSQARRLCIEHYGTACIVCNFDFMLVYGEIGRNYIHVHHLVPLSEIREDHEVDPIADLRPVCPNCHAVIHRRTPPYSIEEVQNFLRSK